MRITGAPGRSPEPPGAPSSSSVASLGYAGSHRPCERDGHRFRHRHSSGTMVDQSRDPSVEAGRRVAGRSGRTLSMPPGGATDEHERADGSSFPADTATRELPAIRRQGNEQALLASLQPQSWLQLRGVAGHHLIAGVIFAAMVPVFVGATQKNASDSARLQAANVAQDKIEKVRQLAYGSIEADAADPARSPNLYNPSFRGWPVRSQHHPEHR